MSSYCYSLGSNVRISREPDARSTNLLQIPKRGIVGSKCAKVTFQYFLSCLFNISTTGGHREVRFALVLLIFEGL